MTAPSTSSGTGGSSASTPTRASTRRWGWLRRLWALSTGELRRGQPGDVTSIAITGPTRCGKTSQCAEPGLLDWAGPAIVLSVKRDLMDTTIAARRELGEVRVFDPGGFLK